MAAFLRGLWIGLQWFLPLEIIANSVKSKDERNWGAAIMAIIFVTFTGVLWWKVFKKKK
jgi:hypothetical protein